MVFVRIFIAACSSNNTRFGLCCRKFFLPILYQFTKTPHFSISIVTGIRYFSDYNRQIIISKSGAHKFHQSFQIRIILICDLFRFIRIAFALHPDDPTWNQNVFNSIPVYVFYSHGIIDCF
ncbi:hypothetical protein D3C84_324780 [compost metagenome]